MRKPERESRLQAYSIPEISSGLDLAVARVAAVQKFAGKKLQKGHALNAIVLHFLHCSEEAQDAILKRHLVEFEELLNQDPPGSLIGQRPRHPER